MNFQDIALGERSRKYYTSANKALRGSKADRKLDIFLAPADATSQDDTHDWSTFLFLGNTNEIPIRIPRLRYSYNWRKVFGSQSDRRFVHGLTICGSVMRLRVFDRSGEYISEKFDAHKHLECFVQVIAGYVLISNSELDLKT